MNAIVWFRKCLRIHDNIPLKLTLEEISKGEKGQIFPVFILDPWFLKPENVGVNRMNFLLESLKDLDDNLRKYKSRLLVLRGNPIEVLTQKIKEWNVKVIGFEKDTEKYAIARDSSICEIAAKEKVKVISPWGHTLYDLDHLWEQNGKKTPASYQSFLKIQRKVGNPSKSFQFPSNTVFPLSSLFYDSNDFLIPSLSEIGYPGGETEALKRMNVFLSDSKRVAAFAKPNTDPTVILDKDALASTTVLSPYLKFGCLSSRLFFHKLLEITEKVKHTEPPVSLLGQLYWREFFYLVAYKTPNFDKMDGNPICIQIPWENDKQKYEAWANAKTGYPWIDAVMTQLIKEGWMHHLARHCVACFLTRGDLWISWELGAKKFEELLIDADWSINNANWMWLSASSFFYQYQRVYSPIAFPKKYDIDGKFVKHYLPILKGFPKEYIYEPWKAPLHVQKAAGCIIGKDYPAPIVDHDKARELNLTRMNLAYSKHRANKNSHQGNKEEEEEEEVDDEKKKPKKKRKTT